MADLNDLQIPIPNNWEKFECLCRELWARLYNDSNAQRVGTPGQQQYGIDIHLKNPSGKWSGIQCRKRQYHDDKDSLTKKEVKETIMEVQNGHYKEISELIIATTEKRKTHFRIWTNELTETSRKQQSFEVVIMAWEDILERLQTHEDLVELYCKVSLTPDSIKKITASLKEEQRASIRDLIIKNSFFPDQSFNLESEYQSELQAIKDLIDQGKPRTALNLLEQLKSRIWDRATDPVKFFLMSLMGQACIKLGQNEKALLFYVEAFQYNSNDEKALLNVAYGYFFSGDYEKAWDYVKQVLNKNPLNSQAWSLQIALKKNQSDDFIKNIPSVCLKTPEVLFTLANLALNSGKKEECLSWLEKAQIINVRKYPDIPEFWAQVLLNSITGNKLFIPGDRLDPDALGKAEKAKNLLEDTWIAIKNTEMAELNTECLANLAIAKRLLNDQNGAIQDLETGLQLNPKNKRLLQLRSLLAFDQKDYKKTIDLFQKLKSVTPESNELQHVLMYAHSLRHEKRWDEAKAELEKNLEKEISPGQKKHLQYLLIQTILNSSGPDRALARTEKFLESDHQNILLLTQKADLLYQRNRLKDALSLLEEMENAPWYQALKNIPQDEYSYIGDVYYALRNYKKAAQYYEKLKPDPLTYFSSRLVFCYYNAGLYSKALPICKASRELNEGPLQDLTKIEISILNDHLQDLEQSTALCQEYLNHYPEDMDIKIQHALNCYRLDQKDTVKDFLDSFKKIDISNWRLEWFLPIANLMFIFDDQKNGLRLLYEARRNFFNEKQAHAQYIGKYLNPNIKGNDYSSQKVEEDTAVCLERHDTSNHWYIIEKRNNPDKSKGELSLEDPLVKLILGRSKGDKVILRSFPEDFVVIKDILSKYQWASNESCEKFPELFPGENDIVKINLSSPPVPDSTLSKIIIPSHPAQSPLINFIGQNLDKILKTTKKWEDLYKTGYLTIEGFAQRTGHHVLDVWFGLMSRADLGIRCCLGNRMEQEEVKTTLAQNKISLVADIITLKTIFNLKVADSIVTVFGKLYVTRSTVDLIQNLILARKSIPDGFMMVEKNSDQLYRTQITKEQIQNSVRDLEDFLFWIKEHCIIHPIKKALNWNFHEKKQMSNIFGESFIDTALLSQEDNMILYSDDWVLRTWSKETLKTAGIWTQAVLTHCLQKNDLPRVKYNDAIVSLILGNYKYVDIDGQILNHAALESKWMLTDKLLNVLTVLGADVTDNTPSAIAVALDFIYQVWFAPISPFQRHLLLTAAFNSLFKERAYQSTMILFQQEVKIKFRFLQSAKEEIFSTLKIIKNAFESAQKEP